MTGKASRITLMLVLSSLIFNSVLDIPSYKVSIFNRNYMGRFRYWSALICLFITRITEHSSYKQKIKKSLDIGKSVYQRLPAGLIG